MYQVNAAVTDFNNKARLLHFIPPSADVAGGIDLTMSAALTAEESSRYESVIRVSCQEYCRL